MEANMITTETLGYTCRRNESMQFLFNNFVLELKDHNMASIHRGFVSRTLADKNFQHTINSLHFLIEGEAILDFNGRKSTLSEGCVFLIGNHVRCSWEYTKESREITLLFNTYIGNLDDVFSNLDRPLLFPDNKKAADEAARLFNNENAVSVLALRNLCLEQVIRAIEQSSADLESKIDIVKKYETVFRAIGENLSMRLTLDELASKTHYSVGFFTKSFPRDNGITVKEYIHDKIMSEVEQLLIYSDLGVGEISEKFEFCESAYFSRWFKKQKGCTPSEYRTQIRAIMDKGET